MSRSWVSAFGGKALRSGYVLLLLSVLCNAVRYHIDAAGLRHGSALASVTVASFCAAATFLLAGWWWRRRGWRVAGLEQVDPLSIWQALRSQGLVLVSGTAAGTLGGWLYARTTQAYGAEVTAFLANLTLVVLVVAGMGAGERLRWLEKLAVGLCVGGAFLFCWRGGKLQGGALVLMGMGCLFQAAKQWLVTRATGAGHLPSVMAASTLLIGTWGLVVGSLSGALSVRSPEALAWFALGGTLGSMLGMSLLYAAYNRIGVSRGAALDALRPLVVLLIGLLLGTPLPGPLRTLGAALVLAGSVLLAWGRPKR